MASAGPLIRNLAQTRLCNNEPKTDEEISDLLGTEMRKYRDLLWKEPEDMAKKLVERRQKLFSNEAMNKLEFKFADESPEPEGTPLDHVLIKVPPFTYSTKMEIAKSFFSFSHVRTTRGWPIFHKSCS